MFPTSFTFFFEKLSTKKVTTIYTAQLVHYAFHVFFFTCSPSYRQLIIRNAFTPVRFIYFEFMDRYGYLRIGEDVLGNYNVVPLRQNVIFSYQISGI